MHKQLLLALFLLPFLAICQHTIQGTFTPAEDYKWAILYRVSPTATFYTADTKIDEAGNFTIQLDSTVAAGMYRLVYALPQEIYNFDIIYNGEEDIELRFNDEEGVSFISSIENKLLSSYENEMYTIRTEIGNRYRDGYTEVASLFDTLEKLQMVFEKESEGTIASNFIKANRIYIPEGSEDLSTYIQNTKSHYFKSVDFSNPTLQCSPFLFDYSMNYIKGFVANSEEPFHDYKNNIDTVAGLAQGTELSFQKVLWIKLWQKFADSNQIDLANYIAEQYLIPVSSKLQDNDLVDQLTVFRNISLGAKAPNFSWETVLEGETKNQNLHNVDWAENYILVFWSSSCSHCLKEIPSLHTKIKSKEKGKYKVIAIGLEDEPYDWRNTIYDFPEFINVLGLGKWENEIGDAYGIDATPTYFLLDKDKKIIAKPEDYKALLALIDIEKK